MQEKIKILSIGSLKTKMKAEDVKNWRDILDRYAPDMYEPINVLGEEDGIKQLINLRPEIVMLSNKIQNVEELLKK